MTDTILRVRTDAPIGTISPRLYGHFAEHLGRCCYDGLWSGNRATTDPQHGFRRDVLEALRALPVPLLRWPGGCYADHYHWRDGIGAPAERPVRLGMSCGIQVEDDNSLGTHEFLWLCAQLGAEPYLAGNVGSGTPQELCDWLEYCNTSVPTTLGRERAANGAPNPFGVKLWGVGNENWGCGGAYEAEAYAYEYRRYATMLRHVDPTAELVICGHTDEWNERLMQAVGEHHDLVDHLSIHRYWINGGPEESFDENDYYTLLNEANETEEFIKRAAQLAWDSTGGTRRIGIALDEWGVWHPEARAWGPRGAEGDIAARMPLTYEQANTMRDALTVAIAFEGFHRQCNVLSLANIAQIVNVLQAVIMTDGPRMWLTPTYHAFRLHAPHIGATALPVAVENGGSVPGGASAVTGTASRNEDGMAITLINRHYSQGADVLLRGDFAGEASATLLAADSPRAGNSLDQPQSVAPAPLQITRDGADLRVTLPAHAMATILLRGA